MGRFLQTDPMGYSDSMNLYQAFNTNPTNFVDPLGLAIINLFVGTEMNEGNAAKFAFVTGGKRTKIPYEYPDWNKLRELSELNGHTLNIFEKKEAIAWRTLYEIKNNYIGKYKKNQIINSEEIKNIFEKSILDEDTWTFFVGHSNIYRGRAVGISFEGSSGIILTQPRTTKNEYIGVLGCYSSKYASSIFPVSQWLFSFREGKGNVKMSVHKALYSVYALIEYLINTKNFQWGKAIEKANEGYQLIGSDFYEKMDNVIIENPILNYFFGSFKESD